MRAATLSTSADEYSLRIGFGNFTTIGSDPADGVFALYDRAVQGDFWGLRTCANSSCSTLKLDGTNGTTSQPLVAGTWYVLRPCVAADGATVTLAVNGVTSGTIASGSAIPLEANARRVAIGSTLIKSVGTNNRTIDLDYLGFDLPFGVAR